MSKSTGLTVADIAAAIDSAFPVQWAEEWDNCGLSVGDPTAAVTGVLVCLDPTPDAVERAVKSGCNVVVTHHPAFLDPSGAFGPGGIGALALSRGVALIAAHTNLDRAPDGAESLPRALGLEPGVPLERSLQPMTLVTTYVPPEAAERLRAAMKQAGGGRIGLYDGCSYSSAGEGRFEPLSGARPVLGDGHLAGAGFATTAPEERVEIVCPPDRAAQVARAASEAHPYEEPLVVVSEVRIARGAARMGRVCTLPETLELSVFAALVGGRLGCTPRVWGAPESCVRVVATATGSGGSLIGDAVAAGADVLVAGEVRYHDALAAAHSGLAIIEAGHDVTEWPLVGVLASVVENVAGTGSRVVVDDPSRGWWTP